MRTPQPGRGRARGAAGTQTSFGRAAWVAAKGIELAAALATLAKVFGLF